MSKVSVKTTNKNQTESPCCDVFFFFSCAQNETFLCHRFTRFVMKYNLMSKDNLIVPILEEEVQNTSSAGESEA